MPLSSTQRVISSSYGGSFFSHHNAFSPYHTRIGLSGCNYTTDIRSGQYFRVANSGSGSLPNITLPPPLIPSQHQSFVSATNMPSYITHHQCRKSSTLVPATGRSTCSSSSSLVFRKSSKREPHFPSTSRTCSFSNRSNLAPHKNLNSTTSSPRT